MRLPFLVLAAALLLSACRDEQAGPKPRTPPLPPATGAAQVLDAPPADLTFRSGATWGNGAVRYLGSKVSPAQPGRPVTVAHYFRAESTPPGGFAFFVHVVDPDTGQMLSNADHEIQDGAMPVGRFPVGKVVEDIHQVGLPPGVTRARLLLGFWAGDSRLPVDQPQAHDGAQRMLGPTLGGEASTLPEYRAPRAAQPPRIDGVLDDAAWAAAPEVVLVGSFDGRQPSLSTRARLTWDEAHLYVAFDSEDPDVWGTFRQRDDPIYTQEAVEIFLDADGDGRTYNELQVSPHNVLFDAYFAERRKDLEKGVLWSSGAVSAVEVRGSLDDDGDHDQGWTVELKIPYANLASVPRIPPVKGDRWRFNLYRLEAHQRKQVEGMAFSPLHIGDFHHLPRFGWLIFD
ncbi:MAG: carbohydrate-binding family 9-like protein [Myxococcota bacterium]|nr:carbohydrate-binding family 9-like protein [Myxococcota bacterium]